MTVLLWHSIARHKRVNFVCVMDAVNGADGACDPNAAKTCFVHVKSGGSKGNL